jgi:hypothetical protein
VPAANQPFPHRSSIDLSAAGWFLLAVGVWEILFNRLASAVGLYRNVGAMGFLSWLANSGRFSMNAVGIMALVLMCASLPRLAANPRFAPLSARVILMLASPFYLPVVCVAIFRPVSAELVLVGYLVAAGSAVFLSLLVAVKKIDPGPRRIVLALGIVQALGAFELMGRFAALFNPSGVFASLTHRSYLLAEVLFAVTPVFAFIVIRPGRLWDFIKRPHVPGLVFACAAAATTAYTMISASDVNFLKLIAFRTVGITVAIPGGAIVYAVSLFFGAFLAGSLILPSKKWPPSAASRRTGFGLLCVWIAGIQPTHPYQFALMILGFVYLAGGMLHDILEAPATGYLAAARAQN